VALLLKSARSVRQPPRLQWVDSGPLAGMSPEPKFKKLAAEKLQDETVNNLKSQE
jgi:hypothetical protein